MLELRTIVPDEPSVFYYRYNDIWVWKEVFKDKMWWKFIRKTRPTLRRHRWSRTYALVTNTSASLWESPPVNLSVEDRKERTHDHLIGEMVKEEKGEGNSKTAAYLSTTLLLLLFYCWLGKFIKLCFHYSLQFYMLLLGCLHIVVYNIGYLLQLTYIVSVSCHNWNIHL